MANKTNEELRNYFYNLGFTRQDVDVNFLKAVLPGFLNDDGTPAVQLRELSPAEANIVNADLPTSGLRHVAIALLNKESLQPVFSLKEITTLAETVGITKLLPLINQARALTAAWTPSVVDEKKASSNPTQESDSSTS